MEQEDVLEVIDVDDVAQLCRCREAEQDDTIDPVALRLAKALLRKSLAYACAFLSPLDRSPPFMV